jgi:adenine-specific DNA methylase
MKVLHTSTETSTQENAIERLENYLVRLRAREISLADIEAFEKEVHEVVMAVEREVVAEGLSQLDMGLPFIEMAGKVYRPRSEVAYLGAAGPIRVKRTLYSTRELGAREPSVRWSGVLE